MFNIVVVCGKWFAVKLAKIECMDHHTEIVCSTAYSLCLFASFPVSKTCGSHQYIECWQHDVRMH